MKAEQTAQSIQAAFGTNVCTVRLIRRVTQERLVEITGLQPNYLGSVECNVSIVIIQKIVDGQGVTWVRFFGPHVETISGGVNSPKRRVK